MPSNSNKIFKLARMANGGDGGESSETSTVVKEKVTVKLPGKYNVVIHNDDYTPMVFVVQVLEQIFNKSRDEAVNLMLYAHNNGKVVAGTYIKSIAEQKVQLTRDVAEKAECHEFKVTMEKA